MLKRVMVDLPEGVYRAFERTVSELSSETHSGLPDRKGHSSVGEYLAEIAEDFIRSSSLAPVHTHAHEYTWNGVAEQHNQAIKELCARHFFEQRYASYMSRYRNAMTNTQHVIPSAMSHLDKYLDEGTALRQIYRAVCRHFQLSLMDQWLQNEPMASKGSMPELPTPDDLDDQFQIELAEMCRHTDLIFPTQITCR